MKGHKHVFHAVEGLKFFWVGKESILDRVKGRGHDPGLEVVDLHALADGVCAMLHELIVKIVLLDVLEHIGFKSKVLVTLLVFERVETGKYALGLSLHGIHAKEVVVEHTPCGTPVGCPGVCLDVAPCWVLAPVIEQDLEHSTVVCVEGQMAIAGFFQGLKIVEIVPVGSVLVENGRVKCKDYQYAHMQGYTRGCSCVPHLVRESSCE
jgi:hypothetical protein